MEIRRFMKIAKTWSVLTLLLVLFLLPAKIFAGDFADLNFIGFSKDGKYLAFEESGTYDGCGGSYSFTYYIDTAKNAYALPPTRIEETCDTPEDERRQKLRNKKLELVKAANLRRLKIVPKNTGDLVLAHLTTDWSAGAFTEPRGSAAEVVRFVYFVLPYSRPNDRFFELTLQPLADKSGTCGEDSRKFDLTLVDRTGEEALPPQVLQSDKSIPESRYCPFGYRIERVYRYEDKIAVFIDYFGDGFEGPDLRYLVVTGILNRWAQ